MPRGVYERKITSLKDRLLAQAMPVTERGCWFFLGSLNHAGYGQINDGFGKCLLAHRASYEIHFGNIPAGLRVLRSCDIPYCVNPDHLSVGTDADNVADKVRKWRHKRKLTADEVASIRSDKHSTHAHLSKQYGISATQVSNIRANRQWAGIG